MQPLRRRMGEAHQHGPASCGRHFVFRRVAEDLRPIGVSDDEAGVVGHNLGWDRFGDGEEKLVAMAPIVAPFLVGAKIGDRRFDFDDVDRAIFSEGHDIGPSP